MMEEVDSIIIHSLRQIGCGIKEEVTNLSGFDTETVVEATVKCLDAIRPGLGLHTTLPPNMAARFRLGATLAQACTELGYKGDIGYQTFLYSSENDLRRVLMFLIEKLPKESDKTLSEPTSEIALLEKSIASVISHSFSIPWLPHFCHKKGFRNRGRANVPYKSVNIEVSTSDTEEEYQDYYLHYMQPVPNQMLTQQCFLPSILSHNAKTMHSQSVNIKEHIDWLNAQQEKIIQVSNHNQSFNRVTLKESTVSKNSQLNEPDVPNTNDKITTTTTDVPQQELVSKKEEMQDLQVEKIKEECENFKHNIDSLQEEIKKLTVQVTQASLTYQNEEKELKINKEQRKIKAKAYELYENGEKNIEKLETVIEGITDKLLNLANQWEKHRMPLIQKYREEREKHSTKASVSQKKQDEIKLLKEKEKELEEECRNKDQLYSQLVVEVQKLPKEINRSAYTQRILEIINNVRKQRDEINKVLADTREIQKEINTLTGRLERSFTVVDELIFRDARTNEASRKAYKLLATLHSDCSELVSLVEETGATIREIRDLEEQIDTESAKNVGANLERITADLKQMKQETAALTAQLQNRNS
ncbi:PREDICTED: coiled-coil domain-containing protein 22 homolog [Polistes dominula]|uniref:Coiled-coil domain-containing protein 22 homolog n=1 Tax=Polistes dominula TaxID=743375 RepID=A0ABM1J4W9_POLDO|nr:PREDICTED: coiled-coil domain-containing protein 22 homolog [Polistes dominula]